MRTFIKINVTDLGGKTVANKVLNGGTLFVAEKGVYVVTVSAGGNTSSSKVLIK